MLAGVRSCSSAEASVCAADRWGDLKVNRRAGVWDTSALNFSVSSSVVWRWDPALLSFNPLPHSHNGDKIILWWWQRKMGYSKQNTQLWWISWCMALTQEKLKDELTDEHMQTGPLYQRKKTRVKPSDSDCCCTSVYRDSPELSFLCLKRHEDTWCESFQQDKFSCGDPEKEVRFKLNTRKSIWSISQL